MLLYIILFFYGVFSVPPTDPIVSFSAINEILRIFTHIIPGLALIWYLILEKKSLYVSVKELKPKKEDLVSFALGFPGLILIGAAVSLLANFVTASSPSLPGIIFEPPENITGWIIIIIACFGTGYLEESYFRFYLLQKFETSIPFTLPRILFPALLFAACHSYEGPWGIISAALSGIYLSVLFLKHKTLHGISWAHACYNIFVYVWFGLKSIS